MDNLSVNLDAYSHSSGFADDAMAQANMSPEVLSELSKALEAGNLQGGDLVGNQTNGGALKTESLEKNLKLITFKESDIRFWKRIPKSAAYNTVEEFNQLTSYGADRGGFNREGELPEEEDSQYVRNAELVKYLGVTKSVTHPMQLVNIQPGIGDIMQRETTNGIQWILRKADRALLFGDSAIIGEEWNGLYAQHLNNPKYATLEDYFTSEVVIDLRGKTLREANIEKGSEALVRNFAQGNLMVAPPRVLSDFAAGFHAAKRINVGQSGAVSGAVVGQHIDKFQSQYGMIDFEYDIFAGAAPGKLSSSGATSPKAPATPTPGGAPAAVAAGDGLSKFGDGIGDYFYAVAGVNRYGESAMVQLGGTLTIAAATEAIDLQFVATAGPYQPTAYVIYRSEVDPSGTYAQTKMHPIFTIPAVGATKRGSLAAGVDGGAAGIVRDRDRWLPEGEEALLMQSDTDVYEFKQLAPLMKMPLAQLSPASRFMVLLYGTPLLYAPDKMIRFINIGRDAS